MNEKRFKILFIFLHTGYVRSYKSVIDYLAEKGHNVIIAFNNPQKDNMVTMDMVFSLFAKNAQNIHIIRRPLPGRDDHWKYASRFIRQMPDFFRYLDPLYKNSPKLRERIEKKTPVFFRILYKCVKLPFFIKLSDWAFRILENVIPSSRTIKRCLQTINPDIVLVTPYVVTPPSSQIDYIKCAKELGIKTIYLVASWDNLTNKGVIKVHTDKVVVWNNIQKREAVKLHRVKPDDVVVTGAQCFDKWFQYKPTESREEFCSRIGLNYNHNYVLYLCSSTFIAPIEADFIRKWVQTIRKHPDPKVNKAGILIRPHPQNIKQWENTDITRFDNVVVYPRYGANPITLESEHDYYHSMYYSSAVVGLNTTAMIEASIVNKPVFTVLDDQFRTTQDGTLHFRYLVKYGLLYISNDLEGHLEQLSKLFNGKISYDSKIKNFVRSFVRPLGTDVQGTEIMGENIIKHCGTEGKKYSHHQLFNIITSMMSLVAYISNVLISLYARCNRDLI